MKPTYKRIAYLAPELPSLSATFVTNEIWSLEEMGVEVIPYSIHSPKNKAHGNRAAQLAKRTRLVYQRSLLENLTALLVLSVTHKRSFLKSMGYLISDLFKTGLVTPKAAKLGYQYFRAAWLAKDLRKNNVEHLHIHFAHVPTQVGMYAAALAGIPFTFMSHANDLFERPLLIPEKINRALKAVTISDYNIKLMSSMGGYSSQMSIVRCGVKAPEDLPQRESESTGPFIIGTLGRLVEKKGIDTLLEAGKILKEKTDHFRIEIAGDGPLMNDLVRKTDQLGLTEHVIFLGALRHADVLTWMGKLDAFVLAGKVDRNGDMDGIPVVLMEAMTLGIPVLSTYLSGIPELVVHEKTGLLSQPGDARELAANLLRITKNPDFTQDIIRAGFQRVTNEFDNELNAERLLRVIHAA